MEHYDLAIVIAVPEENTYGVFPYLPSFSSRLRVMTSDAEDTISLWQHAHAPFICQTSIIDRLGARMSADSDSFCVQSTFELGRRRC